MILAHRICTHAVQQATLICSLKTEAACSMAVDYQNNLRPLLAAMRMRKALSLMKPAASA